MIFKGHLDPPGITFHALNHGLLVAGLLIVWLASHSFLAIIGAAVAAIHVRVLVHVTGSDVPKP